jgi:hypothetical protein
MFSVHGDSSSFDDFPRSEVICTIHSVWRSFCTEGDLKEGKSLEFTGLVFPWEDKIKTNPEGFLCLFHSCLRRCNRLELSEVLRLGWGWLSCPSCIVKEFYVSLADARRHQFEVLHPLVVAAKLFSVMIQRPTAHLNAPRLAPLDLERTKDGISR